MTKRRKLQISVTEEASKYCQNSLRNDLMVQKSSWCVVHCVLKHLASGNCSNIITTLLWQLSQISLLSGACISSTFSNSIQNVMYKLKHENFTTLSQTLAYISLSQNIVYIMNWAGFVKIYTFYCEIDELRLSAVLHSCKYHFDDTSKMQTEWKISDVRPQASESNKLVHLTTWAGAIKTLRCTVEDIGLALGFLKSLIRLWWSPSLFSMRHAVPISSLTFYFFVSTYLQRQPNLTQSYGHGARRLESICYSSDQVANTCSIFLIPERLIGWKESKIQHAKVRTVCRLENNVICRNIITGG